MIQTLELQKQILKSIITNSDYFDSYDIVTNIGVFYHIENNLELFEVLDSYPDNVKKDISKAYNMIMHLKGRLMTDDPFNIETAYKTKNSRKWEYFYMYVDIHSTILYPDYDGLAKKYYPVVKDCLKRISENKDISLVLYTCSHKHEIAEYLDFFSESDIEFDGVNRVVVKNTRGGDFTDKPYFNVLLEDKAGFKGVYDWYYIDTILKYYED